MDGKSAAGDRGGRGPLSRAHDLLAFHHPPRPEDRPGRWQRYFRRWEQATRQNLRGNELDLVPSLARHVPPAVVLDKPFYSAFARSGLYDLLVARELDTLVVTGGETDVCVLASVLSAIDLGFRVVIIDDALCSSSDESHDALMTRYRTRFHEQIDLIEWKSSSGLAAGEGNIPACRHSFP